MKNTILAALVAPILTSGCFSVTTVLPTHDGRTPAHSFTPPNAPKKPSLSITVTRERGSTAVDDSRLKTLQSNLKTIFQDTGKFSRISTGPNTLMSDYSIRLEFSECYFRNSMFTDGDVHTVDNLIWPYMLTLGVFPARIARYDSTYLVTYSDNQKKLYSKGLYHRDAWYGWLSFVFTPFVDPFCTRPTSRSILVSLIQDIQFQGGFDDLDMLVR